MSSKSSKSTATTPTAITALRQRMLEDMAARKLGHQTQRSHVSSCQSWLHSFGRCGRWNVCLTARTVVRANQEKR